MTVVDAKEYFEHLAILAVDVCSCAFLHDLSFCVRMAALMYSYVFLKVNVVPVIERVRKRERERERE